MTHTIQNISRRPITIICNSGKAIHMSPDYYFDVSDTEIKTNKMIKKLLGRNLIRQAAASPKTTGKAASTESNPKKKAKATSKA